MTSIDKRLNKLQVETQEICIQFYAQLKLLGSRVRIAAQHKADSLPEMREIELSMARLRKLSELFERVSYAHASLRYIADDVDRND